MDDDAGLLARYAQRHDAAAYAELTRRYAGLVYGTSVRILGSPQDAEDVTQECFLALARQADRIQESVAGWLHAGARSRSLDALRSSKRRRIREKWAMVNEGREREPTWDQIQPCVDEALAELPEELRRPVLMHYLAGRTQCEVARELGVGQATVSRRIEQGITQLRAILQAKGIAPCAVVLAGQLQTHGTIAMPAALGESLVKIGMAGIGKTAAASSGSGLGAIAMANKVAIAAVAAVLGLGMIGTAYMRTRQPAAGGVSALHAADATPTTTREVTKRMRPMSGEWRRDEDAWVGKGFPGAVMVLPEALASDAIVVEYDGRAEYEEQWSRGLICKLSAYPSPAQSEKAGEIVREFSLRGGFVEKYPWTSIFYCWSQGQWSRDIVMVNHWGDFGSRLNRWYHVKAERIGQRLRMWVDGVVVCEEVDGQKTPEKLYAWLGSSVSENRFKNIQVYRPDDSYVARYSKPVKVFAPYQQRMEILAKYPNTVVREASIALGKERVSDGLMEVDYKGITSVAATDADGQECRRTSLNSSASNGCNFLVDGREGWNARNETFVDVEYLDAGPGAFAVLYQTWWHPSVSSVDVPITGSGVWKKARLWLREADLAKSKDASFWLPVLRPAGKELYLRSVRVVEVIKPKEAWEEIIQAYRKEIDQRTGEWTVPHYMLEIARILEEKLERRKEAEELVKEVERLYPQSECLDMYRQWKAAAM